MKLNIKLPEKLVEELIAKLYDVSSPASKELRDIIKSAVIRAQASKDLKAIKQDESK